MKRLLSLSVVLALMMGVMAAVPAAADNLQAKEYPYSAIAQMNIVFKCGCKRTGTGVMVGRKGMLTAGHMLVCPYHSSFADSIQFRFGVKNSRDCLYSYTGGYKMCVQDNFKRSDGSVRFRSQDDIGFVVFDKNVGDKTGWFGVSAPSDYDLSGERFHFMGYQNGQIVTDWMFTYPTSNNQFTFTRHGSDQLCGSPIYVWDEGCSYPVVLGVFSGIARNHSIGRKVTSDLISWMSREGAVQ